MRIAERVIKDLDEAQAKAVDNYLKKLTTLEQYEKLLKAIRKAIEAIERAFPELKQQPPAEPTSK